MFVSAHKRSSVFDVIILLARVIRNLTIQITKYSYWTWNPFTELRYLCYDIPEQWAQNVLIRWNAQPYSTFSLVVKHVHQPWLSHLETITNPKIKYRAPFQTGVKASTFDSWLENLSGSSGTPYQGLKNSLSTSDIAHNDVNTNGTYTCSLLEDCL